MIPRSGVEDKIPNPASVVFRLAACVSLSAALCGCFGYVPGRQSYWDARVKELCEKDGGVVVYERVALTEAEYKLLRGPGGSVVIPSKRSAGPDAPYVREMEETIIRTGDPQVTRLETRIIRTADRKVLSRSITYGRMGGDFPSPAFPSSFSCRDLGPRSDIERLTFAIPEANQ